MNDEIGILTYISFFFFLIVKWFLIGFALCMSAWVFCLVIGADTAWVKKVQQWAFTRKGQEEDTPSEKKE